MAAEASPITNSANEKSDLKLVEYVDFMKRAGENSLIVQQAALRHKRHIKAILPEWPLSGIKQLYSIPGLL